MKKEQLIRQLDRWRFAGISKGVMVLHNNHYLSCVTGSHVSSNELGTIEVALLNEEGFVFGEDDSDLSIIHYMEWDDFVSFMHEMHDAEVTEYKNIFKKYYDKQK